MNASKTLTAAIAAATIVGTVGYVSAQTTTEPATTAPSQEMQQPMQQPSTTAPADSSTAPSATGSSATPAPSATDSSTTPMPNAAPTNVPSSSSDMSTPAVTSDVNAAPAEPAPKADRN